MPRLKAGQLWTISRPDLDFFILLIILEDQVSDDQITIQILFNSTYETVIERTTIETINSSYKLLSDNYMLRQWNLQKQ